MLDTNLKNVSRQDITSFGAISRQNTTFSGDKKQKITKVLQIKHKEHLDQTIKPMNGEPPRKEGEDGRTSIARHY